MCLNSITVIVLFLSILLIDVNRQYNFRVFSYSTFKYKKNSLFYERIRFFLSYFDLSIKIPYQVQVFRLLF